MSGVSTLRSHFERTSHYTRWQFLTRLWGSERAIEPWDHEGFIPIRSASESECQGCLYKATKTHWWYHTDLIGHSITLPLSKESIQNLTALQPKLDLQLVIQILEAKANPKVGIFKEIEGMHPTRQLTEVLACEDCARGQSMFAWVEELCQIWDIVDAMERAMEAERGYLNPARKNHLWIDDAEWKQLDKHRELRSRAREEINQGV